MIERELIHKFNQIKNNISNLIDRFDLSDLEDKIEELEKKTTEANFWDDNSSAQKVIKSINILKDKKNKIENVKSQIDDIDTLLELYEAEEDETLISDFNEMLEEFEKSSDELEIEFLLKEEYDSENAIVSIRPGAGGVDSSDWADILFTMYKYWCEKNGFKIKIYDINADKPAGIKNVTFVIEGNFAYGLLRAENGIHRLVRISPFDQNKRRHTSFASVEIIPEFNDDVEIEIDEKDLKIDTYRASGAGGQHVNTTDSAIRITHLPTNTVVTCQNERSQLANKNSAMKLLKSRLYQKKVEEERKKKESLRGDQKKIEWGSQIRSYFMHPNTLVKDHRTKIETGNINDVLNGNLEKFIKGYLLESL